eukprot:195891_1
MAIKRLCIMGFLAVGGGLVLHNGLYSDRDTRGGHSMRLTPFTIMCNPHLSRDREVSPIPGKRRVGRNVLIGNVRMSQQLTGGGCKDPINRNRKSRPPSKVRDSAVGSSRDGSSDLRRRLDKQKSDRGGSESARRNPILALKNTVKRPEEDDEMGCLGAIPTEPLRQGKSATKVSTIAKEKENYLKHIKATKGPAMHNKLPHWKKDLSDFDDDEIGISFEADGSGTSEEEDMADASEGYDEMGDAFEPDDEMDSAVAMADPLGLRDVYVPEVVKSSDFERFSREGSSFARQDRLTVGYKAREDRQSPAARKNRKRNKKIQTRGVRHGSRSRGATVTKEEDKRVLVSPEPVCIQDLAAKLGINPSVLTKYLRIYMGIIATTTQFIDAGSACTVVESFGQKAVREDINATNNNDADGVGGKLREETEQVISTGLAIDADDLKDLFPRPPVVTIMGHVDHGKTSILDAIRDANVAQGEAGGITQHIHAYQVPTTESREVITFLDTPGHEAFSAMRTRGANITDVVVLVVAADEGAKDQTIESIAMAKLTGVPIVLAINKMDKAEANPQKVLNDLMQYDLLTTDAGGDVEMAHISAKNKEGLSLLLEKILLQAEVLELKADPNREARGVVIEVQLQNGIGTIATVLVQKGTLNVGDIIVAGTAWGRVRSLVDCTGRHVTQAGPSMPVGVVGFRGMPSAGDALIVVNKEDMARSAANARLELKKKKEAGKQHGKIMKQAEAFLSANMAEKQHEKEVIELCVYVKADAHGSTEALTSSIKSLKSEDEYFICKPRVIGSGVGDLSKSDVAIASVSNSFVMCFNVGAKKDALDEARRTNVEIGYYSVVYEALDDVQRRIDDKRAPAPQGVYIGRAIVEEVFNIGKVGNIAGSVVVDGMVKRGTCVRVMRLGRVKHEGTLKTLRNLKQDVEFIASGAECGIQVAGYQDFEKGDYLECFAL